MDIAKPVKRHSGGLRCAVAAVALLVMAVTSGCTGADRTQDPDLISPSPTQHPPFEDLIGANYAEQSEKLLSDLLKDDGWEVNEFTDLIADHQLAVEGRDFERVAEIRSDFTEDATNEIIVDSLREDGSVLMTRHKLVAHLSTIKMDEGQEKFTVDADRPDATEIRWTMDVLLHELDGSETALLTDSKETVEGDYLAILGWVGDEVLFSPGYLRIDGNNNWDLRLMSDPSRSIADGSSVPGTLAPLGMFDSTRFSISSEALLMTVWSDNPHLREVQVISELVWVNYLDGPIVPLGPGEFHAANSTNFFVAVDAPEAATIDIKQFTSSAGPPALGAIEPMLTVPRDSGFSVGDLSATDSHLFVTLHDYGGYSGENEYRLGLINYILAMDLTTREVQVYVLNKSVTYFNVRVAENTMVVGSTSRSSVDPIYVVNLADSAVFQFPHFSLVPIVAVAGEYIAFHTGLPADYQERTRDESSDEKPGIDLQAAKGGSIVRWLH